jgi:hypothetical protein
MRIDKVVVGGGYLNVYFTNVPQAKGSTSVEGHNNWFYETNVILQDLDNPRLSWNGITQREDLASGHRIITFQGVTAKRFSVTNKWENNPPNVFDEIILGEPDE